MSAGFELNPISSGLLFSFKQVALHSLQMDHLLQCLGRPCFYLLASSASKHSVLYDPAPYGTGAWISEKDRNWGLLHWLRQPIHRAANTVKQPGPHCPLSFIFIAQRKFMESSSCVIRFLQLSLCLSANCTHRKDHLCLFTFSDGGVKWDDT